MHYIIENFQKFFVEVFLKEGNLLESGFPEKHFLSRTPRTMFIVPGILVLFLEDNYGRAFLKKIRNY